jgi:uncharacterized protein YdcH (DUF465 family)
MVKGREPMSNTPHELAEDFPQDAEKIHELKTQNAHFAKLAADYHEVNRAVHRAETGVEPLEELAEMALRKERMRLKDKIAAMLAAA